VRNAKLVGQSIISYLQKKGYPEVCNKNLLIKMKFAIYQLNRFPLIDCFQAP